VVARVGVCSRVVLRREGSALRSDDLKMRRIDIRWAPDPTGEYLDPAASLWATSREVNRGYVV